MRVGSRSSVTSRSTLRSGVSIDGEGLDVDLLLREGRADLGETTRLVLQVGRDLVDEFHRNASLSKGLLGTLGRRLVATLARTSCPGPWPRLAAVGSEPSRSGTRPGRVARPLRVVAVAGQHARLTGRQDRSRLRNPSAPTRAAGKRPTRAGTTVRCPTSRRWAAAGRDVVTRIHPVLSPTSYARGGRVRDRDGHWPVTSTRHGRFLALSRPSIFVRSEMPSGSLQKSPLHSISPPRPGNQRVARRTRVPGTGPGLSAGQSVGWPAHRRGEPALCASHPAGRHSPLNTTEDRRSTGHEF